MVTNDVQTVQIYMPTVDSKIHENLCKQKNKLNQVMGTLYRYISFTEVLYTPYFTCLYEKIV